MFSRAAAGRDLSSLLFLLFQFLAYFRLDQDLKNESLFLCSTETQNENIACDIGNRSDEHGPRSAQEDVEVGGEG
jgi:hypothetical protein